MVLSRVVFLPRFLLSLVINFPSHWLPIWTPNEYFLALFRTATRFSTCRSGIFLKFPILHACSRPKMSSSPISIDYVSSSMIRGSWWYPSLSFSFSVLGSGPYISISGKRQVCDADLSLLPYCSTFWSPTVVLDPSIFSWLDPFGLRGLLSGSCTSSLARISKLLLEEGFDGYVGGIFVELTDFLLPLLRFSTLVKPSGDGFS